MLGVSTAGAADSEKLIGPTGGTSLTTGCGLTSCVTGCGVALMNPFISPFTAAFVSILGTGSCVTGTASIDKSLSLPLPIHNKTIPIISNKIPTIISIPSVEVINSTISKLNNSKTFIFLSFFPNLF